MSGHSTYCRNGTLFFDSYVYRLEKQGSTYDNPDDISTRLVVRCLYSKRRSSCSKSQAVSKNILLSKLPKIKNSLNPSDTSMSAAFKLVVCLMLSPDDGSFIRTYGEPALL